MGFKYLRNSAFVVFLLLGVLVSQAQAKTPRRNLGTLGEVTLSGRVIQFNEAHRFVVINLGDADGIKKGMVINVFRGDEETARIKVSKVRSHISACDIQMVYKEKGIAIGDAVIYKQPSVPVKIAKKAIKPLEPTEVIEIEPIVVDIDAPKRTILSKTLKVFREFGAIVTGSDSLNYTLRAHKNLKMPLGIDLRTEWGPYVRNKVYYTVEVTTTPRYNRLIIHLRGVYDREGQTYNREIEKNSSTYKEAQVIAFTIKDLAEKL